MINFSFFELQLSKVLPYKALGRLDLSMLAFSTAGVSITAALFYCLTKTAGQDKKKKNSRVYA